MKKYFIAMMAAMLLSLPTWVKTVKANDLNDQQLDAVTGATPLTEASRPSSGTSPTCRAKR